MQYAQELIQKECTGKPQKFAQKLRISERMLYLYIQFLKTEAFTVKYDRKRKTFLFRSLQ